MRVKKRDGKLVAFEMTKIQRALLMAFQGSAEIPDVMPLVRSVVDRLVKEGEEIVEVGEVGHVVEEVLVSAGWADIGRRYMRYRLRRDAARAVRLVPDETGLADYITVAKYARWNGTLGRREVFGETVDRVEAMHTRRWPEFSGEIREAFGLVRRRMVMPSMRSMQFGGAAIEQNNERMYNCSFTHIDRFGVFGEIYYLLLCGCGVGYSVQWCHVEKLGELGRVSRKRVEHWIVEDNIEGWGHALGALIRSYTNGGAYVEYAYHLIRAEGSPLVTSGGRAPGHLPLKECLEKIRAVLDKAAGRCLRPIECHDIVCYMAESVLAGGIRRSSLISLFSLDDTEMMYAKARGNYGDGINPQRAMANNSAVLVRDSVGRAEFERVLRIAAENYGDPGFYFTSDCDYGPNPCGEIGMHPVGENGGTGVQFCNLCEVNVAGCASPSLFYDACRAAAFIGTLQAAYTQFPYLGEVTEQIVRRDALIGIGLTGIMDNTTIGLDPDILRAGAGVVLEENARVARLLGIKQAARCCCVKPSGTASLVLGGIGAGIHPRWARRYFQRVTAIPLERVAAEFRRVNPHMVEEVEDGGDWKLVFPIVSNDGAITAREQRGIEFLQCVLTVYNGWVLPGTRDKSDGLTHNVSCTVMVGDDEVSEVISGIWEARDSLCAMTIAPKNIDKKFHYAPREAVVSVSDEARWNNLIRLYRPVDWTLFREERDNTSHAMEPACSGGTCEIS